MESKLKIGILGCADVAWRLVIPNMLSTNKFDLVAISSRTENKANKFAKTFGCEAVLGYENLLSRKDIESVYIPLPTGMHYEWVIKALNAGKHVFVEKSLATNHCEANEIINIAKNKQLCIFENFMFTFHSQFEFVKKIVTDGEIGEIKLLRSSFGFPEVNINSNIRYQKTLGGGALLDAGAYTIMASQLFLGSNQRVLASSLENSGREVDFHGSVMLKNENGIVSQLAFGFDNFYQNNIELWGNKGKLFVDRAFTSGPEIMPKIILEKKGIRSEYILPTDNHFHKILNKFYECIKSHNEDYLYNQILCQSKLITETRKIANSF